MPVVDQVYKRIYSKGAGFWLNYGGSSIPSVITEAYLSTFTKIAGVKTIKGPKMGRDTVDLQELDQVPPLLTSPNFTTSQNNLVVPAETREQYFNKVKAPGDKDYGPIALTINMTNTMFQVLSSLQERDIPFPYFINLRSSGTTFATLRTSRTIFFGFGFVQTLGFDVQPSELVQVSCSVQPSFGVGFASVCTSLAQMARVWQNFLEVPSCP